MSNEESVGVIGVGNMGGAIVRGVVEDDSERPVFIFDEDRETMDDIASEYDVQSTSSLDELVSEADVIVLAVKPKVVPAVLDAIDGNEVRLASIAAGVTVDTLRSHLPPDAHVIRVMPNTPAQVGEGMSFLAPGPDVSESFVDTVRDIFESVGSVEIVDEAQMDAVTALSGSGPAYVFYVLEALEEAGVYMGLDPDQARAAAEQTVLGASTLARERADTGPAELRREVSSPGGTTVEAIKSLDASAVKGAFIEALDRAREKSEDLGS